MSNRERARELAWIILGKHSEDATLAAHLAIDEAEARGAGRAAKEIADLREALRFALTDEIGQRALRAALKA